MRNTPDLNHLKKLFSNFKEQALDDYFTFLKFKSISSEPAYHNQNIACANWVAEYLKKIHFDVEIWPTSGHPTIFASYSKAGPSQPTLLIYNHYDVQPVDPLEQWESPPFEPREKNGKVYARGAQDNKGQCFYVLWAMKLLIESQGNLPINVKLCIEGDEECGSAGLSEILKDKSKKLQADYLAIVDLGLRQAKTPSITIGVRGLVAMDVEVSGSHHDLHSGDHGGLAFNPIHALVKLLAMIRDESGKINIPGFYDDIVPLTKEEASQLSFTFDPKNYEKNFGSKPTGGENILPHLERNWTRPTLEINGISGGYSGTGFKTVIPAKAHAKISCRLVPNQDPEKVGRLVAAYLESHAPEGTKVSVTVLKGSGKALRTHADSPAVKAFAQAYQEVFQAPCEYIYSGASIPIVAELAAASKADVVLVGMGLSDDCIHAPNEHFGIDRIEKGFLATARVLEILKNSSQ